MTRIIHQNLQSYGVFFPTIKYAFYLKKNLILCLFTKRMVCFILNNSHLPRVEGIAYYVLYKSRVLIPCKADDFIYRATRSKFKSRLVSLSNFEVGFSLFCGVSVI